VGKLLVIVGLLMVVWGAYQTVATVFDAADASMGLMATINLIAIVALSGMISAVDEPRLSAAGFDDLLSKPVELSRLVQTVRAHLAGTDAALKNRGRGHRILVVDDSPTVRKLISGKLEKSGHVVVCASDGVEALEQLENGLPDLVLLDITMPRMDGYEVCKQIRSNPEAKDLPVVMISGKDGFFDKVRGRMAGSTGYVTKPFGPETLMKALETYLLPEA